MKQLVRWRRAPHWASLRDAVIIGLALLAHAEPALAQRQKLPRPGQAVTPPDTTRRPGVAGRRAQDSAATDTTRRELVRWTEPDSVMAELLGRPGYLATRYQGTTVRFEALERSIYLEGKRAAVSRDETVIVGDTLLYNDSTQIVRARGDTVILRDPSRGEGDLVARGSIVYNIAQQRGVATNISTKVTEGETWYVSGEHTGFVNDTTAARHTAFYARDGTLTSCDETIPHYHFESKEIKVVSKRLLVARPAILYIADVPILWLPFIFQDMRSGRRSGMLAPRFGVGELVRNSPFYRRNVENVGYYFALSDYMDAQVWLDWRSGARARPEDPGFFRYNAETNYRWLNRFISGRLAANYLQERGGINNLSLSLGHQQAFSERRQLSTNINYVRSTVIRQRNIITPAAVLATIVSTANYSQPLGPFAMALGGTRRQYPGREQVDTDFPNLNLSPNGPIAIAPWLEWTPTLNIANRDTRNEDSPGALAFRFFPSEADPGVIDSARIGRSSRSTNVDFRTPFTLKGYNIPLSFTLRDREINAPSVEVTDDPAPGRPGEFVSRRLVFARTYETAFNFETGVSLPPLFQGTWNVVPSVSIMNVDGGDFAVRTHRSGGRFVTQSKRLSYGVGASPTFYGLFPGVGPVRAIRHAISPTIGFSFSPPARVSDDYLNAVGRSRKGYLGTLAQNRVSLGLSQNVEVKLRGAPGVADTSATGDDGGRKLKVLSLNFSALSYDFERLRKTGRSGFTDHSFNYSLDSELLPGFQLNSSYSLFEGDPLSDTARFSPYRESVNASFSINRTSNVLVALTRIFGRAIPNRDPGGEQNIRTQEDNFTRQVAAQPVAGSAAATSQFAVPSGQGFQASITYTSQRSRPSDGPDPFVAQIELVCERFFPRGTQRFNDCLRDPLVRSQVPDTVARIGFGSPRQRLATTRNVGLQTSFDLTQKWAASWSTNYDFTRKEFASHVVSLQRELHDWRAIFAFTQSPTGAFAFNFFISLNAQPDLKFEYDKQTYRGIDTFR